MTDVDPVYYISINSIVLIDTLLIHRNRINTENLRQKCSKEYQLRQYC